MALLKEPLSAAQKAVTMRRLQLLAALAVSTQNYNLSSDTQLILSCCGGDSARAAPLIAATSSASGLIEFLLNPVLGKLADRFGRKAVYYIGPLVSGVAMSVAVLATRGTSLPVLLAHRALGWALISMSCSFIVPVSVSDMFSGQELGVNIAQVFATMGMGMVIAPYLGMLVMVRTGSALNVYKLRAASALVQLAVLFCAIPETLEASKVLPVTLASLNPFRFIAIARAPRTLRTLAATLFFNFFAEGKNIISLIQVWMVGNPLNWSVEVQARQSVVYGLFMFLSGKLIAPRMIHSLGQRGFTTAANVCNAVGTGIMGLPLPSYGASFWLGHVVSLPGINNTSAAAVKAMAIDHAVAAGFGRGEWGGMYSSLRTFSMIVAPLIYSTAYTMRDRPGLGWMSPWFVVAVLGAVVPECLHRTLSDQALRLGK